MSNKLRNPFKTKASEKIESVVSFLKLFSPLVLDSLSDKYLEGKLWDNVVFIHSSPGAGKTSLIRLFEPTSLSALLNNKSAADYKELFNALKKINAISEDRIQILGITLTCNRKYGVLEDLNISPGQKTRFFFSLLNSRLILAALRAMCIRYQMKFPEDLREIEFNYNNADNFFVGINTPCSGVELFQWASNIENNIYLAIDSFIPSQHSIVGHDELFSLLVLRPDNFTIKGQVVCDKFLFMLDDAHTLPRKQRDFLKRYVIEKRGNFSLWVSERLEALDSVENLGSFITRDYDEINLENFWRKNSSKFEKILRSISDKRAAVSTEDVNSFYEYLDSNLNEEKYKFNLLRAIEETTININNIVSYTDKFDEWVKYLESYQGSYYERALLLKMIEILIYRNIGKSQLSFDFALTQEELENKLASDIAAAAAIFLSNSAKIPYYFGFSSLVKLSSSNIEQFLSFSGHLFEEMISSKISGNEIRVNEETQEKIIKNIVNQKWKELGTIIPYSVQVKNFLMALGDFSYKETFKPNAPYSPGVNGFAIKTNSAKLIDDELDWTLNPIYEPLVNVISTCVAYNLLEVHTTNQGKKGQLWDVYYLNRWLCVKFNLPLSYGGWRHKSVDELTKWIKK